ncbi:hypothetical protein L1049_027530 [Liquidambar formosana]|uniref:Disease resistance protein At4g27190-like leucine-rich repeats domain-containing protein n=1 Tax=Liquidambar formosana TaxID=63359 RepID=A0AAP0WVI7_LIQFO
MNPSSISVATAPNIGEGDADLALTHLKILRLKSLPKLTHLWEMVTLGIQGFQNLQCLEVEDCQSLKYVFTPSIAKLLVKLEELCIINCAIVEIVGKDQEGGEEIEEATKVIQFPQLNKLHLTILQDFVSFGVKPYTFKWPVLKELFVDNSGMKVLIPTFQGVGKQKTITMTSHEEVHEQQIIFPSLEVLTLDHVEGILDGQLLAHSFCNLREIRVIKCNQLLAVPSNWLPAGLQKLEDLWIDDCASLVEVFEVEGLNVEERDAVLLPMLKRLCLWYLPKLERLLNEKELEVDQEIGQEEHLVKELEVNQEIEQEEHLVKESEVNQEEHLVKELEVNQEVGQEEHLDNNDDDHEN